MKYIDFSWFALKVAHGSSNGNMSFLYLKCRIGGEEEEEEEKNHPNVSESL